MHLVADGSRKCLICYLFVVYLLSKTYRVDYTFHLIQFCLWDVLKIGGNGLIIFILVLLAICSIFSFDNKPILFSIFSAEVLDHILLEIFRCLAHHLALGVIRLLRRLIWQVFNVLSFLRCGWCLFLYRGLFTFISLGRLLGTVRCWTS